MMTHFTFNDVFAILTFVCGFLSVATAIISRSFLTKADILGVSFNGLSAGIVGKTAKLNGKAARASTKVAQRSAATVEDALSGDGSGALSQGLKGTTEGVVAVTALVTEMGGIFLWMNSGTMLATTSFGISSLAVNNVGFTNNGYTIPSNATNPSGELDAVYVMAWIAMFANGLAVTVYVLSMVAGGLRGGGVPKLNN